MAKRKRRQFTRRLLGYQRAAVDEHLDRIDATIEELRSTLESQEADRGDLVLRATRRSVEAVMADAHQRAAEVVEDAHRQARDIVEDGHRVAGAIIEEARRQAEPHTGRDPDEVIDLRSAPPVETA